MQLARLERPAPCMDSAVLFINLISKPHNYSLRQVLLFPFYRHTYQGSEYDTSHNKTQVIGGAGNWPQGQLGSHPSVSQDGRPGPKTAE